MKPITIYLLVWIFLSVIWFFSSETIVNWILPGSSNVKAWLFTVFGGMAFFLVELMALYLVIFSRARKK